jgi:hypothetical protein
MSCWQPHTPAAWLVSLLFPRTHTDPSVIAHSPVPDVLLGVHDTPILVEIKCVYGHHNTTVFSNYWRNQLHVFALFWVGQHQVETRISKKTHTLQCGLYIKNGGTRSRFTMFGEVFSYMYAMWNVR